MASQHDTLRLAIDEDMTIYNAAPLKARLLTALAACQRLELDLDRVMEIDTTGLQLLALLKNESVRLGKSLSLARHGATVREAIDCFGMAGFFGDPVVITACEPA